MVSRVLLGLCMALLAGTLTVSGCSQEARHRVLATLFDGVPGPGEKARPQPVVRRPRHPLPTPSPTPLLVEVEPPEPAQPESPFPTWQQALRKLPKDPAGGVDWVRALREKAIEPRPGLDPEAKPQPVFPLAVERVPANQPLFTVTFPHEAHTQWLGCANCHPAIFEMRKGANPINMAKIFAGEYCGRCHGKVAFPVPTGCPRCHLGLAPPRVATPAAPPAPPKEPPAAKLESWAEVAAALPKDGAGNVDWVRALAEEAIAPRASVDRSAPPLPVLDLDIERLPAAGATFKVVFPHRPHTQWLTCTNCHPAIFEMRKGANPINMAKIFAGEYCGRCHGKVAFPVPTGCPRCHVNLAPPKPAAAAAPGPGAAK